MFYASKVLRVVVDQATVCQWDRRTLGYCRADPGPGPVDALSAHKTHGTHTMIERWQHLRSIHVTVTVTV
jgi:hypothetical protein